jgi:hypothetical protein
MKIMKDAGVTPELSFLLHDTDMNKNENIQREYQINTNFKKKYYMIHNGAPNIYYVNFIYFKGLKYIRKQYNDRNIHFRYTKNFVSLKYYSMFFNIL